MLCQDRIPLIQGPGHHWLNAISRLLRAHQLFFSGFHGVIPLPRETFTVVHARACSFQFCPPPFPFEFASANRALRRCTGTPVAASSLGQDNPPCRNAAAFSTSNSLARRPQCLPRRCASFMPATTRSLINSRSDSAIAASTENTACPLDPRYRLTALRI
jgi:hypothetical protein